jgi:hypothetical protein
MTANERALVQDQDLLVIDDEHIEGAPSENNRTCPMCKHPCSIQGVIPIYVGADRQVKQLEREIHVDMDHDDDLTLSTASSLSIDESYSFEDSSQALSEPTVIPRRPTRMTLVALSHLALTTVVTTPVDRLEPATAHLASLSNGMVSLVQILASTWTGQGSRPRTDRYASLSRLQLSPPSENGSLQDINYRYSDRALHYYLTALTIAILAFITCVDV